MRGREAGQEVKGVAGQGSSRVLWGGGRGLLLRVRAEGPGEFWERRDMA